MNRIDTSESRRRFIKVTLASAAAVPLAALSQRATAAELPHLDESDPTAKALGYVHDANTVSADVRGDANRICSSCRFYIKDDPEWGPCTLFPGKAVAAQGWCKSWVAKA